MNDVKKNNMILPIKYPIISSYTQYAHMLAILNSYPSTEDWIFNNYINLWGERPKDNPDGLSIRFGSWCTMKDCPYFKMNFYDKDSFDLNVVEFIVSEINSGYYLNISYDPYYIMDSDAYNKMHYDHQMLIYGYDNESKVFYIADFFKSSKYTFMTSSFDSVKNAVNSALKLERFSCVEIKFCDTTYEFSNYILYNSLNSFLCSRLRSENHIYREKDESMNIGVTEAQGLSEGLYTFGIENYNLLKFTLTRILNDKIDFYDMKPLYVIFDHKVIMCERLRYLAKKGIISYNDSINDKYDNVKNISRINYQVFIKFLITKNYKLIGEIIDNLNKMESLEKEALTYLIEKVSEKL